MMLDWDNANLACDTSGQCLEGFSCLGPFGSDPGECIEDNSRAIDETCTVDTHCQSGLLCVTVSVQGLIPFTCQRPCCVVGADGLCQDGPFYDQGSCGSREFCQPIKAQGSGPGGERRDGYLGICVAGNGCSGDADCSPVGDGGDTCVAMNGGASTCVSGCQVDFVGADYSQNCASPVGFPDYCQPIGRDREQRLICMPSATFAQDEGNVCFPVTLPCKQGLLCTKSGVCRRHCDPDAPAQCLSTEICCPKDLLDGRYAFCSPLSVGCGS
ncbi:MAG: hypothetical protein R3C68_00840 [Myxococcota bacterium]